ncbi:MAG: TonB-dependent receptor [Bacteroidales bacterium]|nr:TonB-dependent receptor [Bacteroidales bacterium]
MTFKQLFLGLLLIFIGTTASFSQEKYSVSGYVKDLKNEKPIIGAAVFELNAAIHGTPTDTEGYFNLEFSKNDVYLKFAYIGFKDTVINLFLYKDTVITVFLKSNTEIEEVKVEDDEINWKLEENSLKIAEKVVVAELTETEDAIESSFFIIPKIEKKTVLIPLDEFLLRNGNGINQTLTFIDGARLYSTKQSFNFIQLVDNQNIQSYQYYYGNFPASYNGYIAPVLDINLKEGHKRRYSGGGTISLFGASIFAEGPVIENNSSFYVSARKTFFNNPYTDLFKSEEASWIKPSFFDLNLKYSHQLNENNKFNFSFLTNRNSNIYETSEENGQFLFNRRIIEKTSNTLSSLKWEHIFSPDFVSEVYVSYSKYNLNYDFEGDSIGLLTGERSRINDYIAEYITGNEDVGINVKFKYNLNFENSLQFGASAVNRHFKPVKANLTLHDFINNNHIDTMWNADTYNAQEYIVFAQDRYIVSDKLTLQGGVHFSTFKTANKTYFSVQPRFYATYKLFKNLKLNASYSNYKQYIHLLANRQVGLSSDIFVASDENILPQFTHHVSAGILIKLPYDIDLTGSAFYENSINVAEYKEQYGFFNYDSKFVLPGKNLKDRIEQGKENKYGLRILLEKKFKKFIFKTAHYITVSDREFENLNFSQQFSYRHNNLHDFKLEMMYKINEDFNVGINWQYQSGNYVTINKQNYIPYNFTEGTLSSNHIENPVFSQEGILIKATNEINSYKLPAYRRADLFVNYSIDNHKFGFHIYNIFNRKNPDYVDFKKGVMSNTGSYQLINYSTLPFFPSLSYTYIFQ